MSQCPINRLGPLPEFLQYGSEDVVRIATPAGDTMWLVGDYALGRLVLTDKRFSREAAVRPQAPKFNDAQPVPESIASKDGAGHARLRRILTSTFTTRRVTAMAPDIERLADHHLDVITDAGPGTDLIEGLAAPLPLTVLCSLLGIPLEDSKRFRDWVEALFDISGSTSPREARRSRLELTDYMAGLIDRKRQQPEDDLLGAMITAHDAGELVMGELITMGLTFLMAGYETTVGQIGLSVHHLLTSPGAYRQLAGHPDRLDATVEELLRVTPTTPLSFSRVATEPVSLGNATIQTGEAVVVSLLHGNRDSKVFPEPDRLAPEGRNAVHLSFGHGLHRCIGAQLARVQLRVVLARLLSRFPTLRLASTAVPVAWKDGMGTRGLTRLLVEW